MSTVCISRPETDRGIEPRYMRLEGARPSQRVGQEFGDHGGTRTRILDHRRVALIP